MKVLSNALSRNVQKFPVKEKQQFQLHAVHILIINCRRSGQAAEILGG